VNFDFTDEQKALKDQARRFLAEVSPLSVARSVLDQPAVGYNENLWARIGEQGWCGAAIPEAYGGLEFGYIELCALAEELGRAVSPVPFAATVYQFAEALLHAGSESQKAELLPLVATGEIIGTLAFSEGPGVLEAGRITTRFENGALHGTKIPVTDGGDAHFAVVLAQSESGPGLFLVNLGGEGISRKRLSSVDPTRGIASIHFDNAAAHPLGEAGNGVEQLARIHDRTAVMLAFEQLGGADRALEMARDYALERYAFGRQIGSYQAIKHKLADVFVKNEVARANTYYAAWALSVSAPELPVAAAAARVAASDAYFFAAKENIQTHGGIGFTWEADCHLFYRRSRHLSLVIGAQRDWKRRLAKRLADRVAHETAGEVQA
jgi:alkylation response protein AidB-like acyl-CoA dehydrogenase